MMKTAFIGLAAFLIHCSGGTRLHGDGHDRDATAAEGPDFPAEDMPAEPDLAEDFDDTDGEAPEHACWLQAAAGEHHTCAIAAPRTLYCWGLNDRGQLGNGTHENSARPVQVGSDSDWSTVAAGWLHTCAIRKNGEYTYGRLFCWGMNAFGQLGDGTTDDRAGPVQVGSDADWRTVSASFSHTCAVKIDGRLFCWGSNETGQLGSGTHLDSSTPVRVAADSDWSAAAAGYGYTCAVKADGRLYCWGTNGYGQLGDGTNEEKTTPVQIGDSGRYWGVVAAGYGHACAIESLPDPDPNGLLHCWGYNNSGQLGNGTQDDVSVPVRAGTDMDWMTVTLGYGHTCGVKMDGRLYCWGYGLGGRLCSGAGGDIPAPVQVGLDSDWLSAAAGMSHTCAVKRPFQLECCGYNEYGQLGDGTNEDRSEPGRTLCYDRP